MKLPACIKMKGAVLICLGGKGLRKRDGQKIVPVNPFPPSDSSLMCKIIIYRQSKMTNGRGFGWLRTARRGMVSTSPSVGIIVSIYQYYIPVCIKTHNLLQVVNRHKQYCTAINIYKYKKLVYC